MTHGPIPGALEVAGDAAFPVATGDQVLGFHQAHQDGIFAVGRGDAELQPDGIFLDQLEAKTRGQLEVGEHSAHDFGPLIHRQSSR